MKAAEKAMPLQAKELKILPTRHQKLEIEEKNSEGAWPNLDDGLLDSRTVR